MSETPTDKEAMTMVRLQKRTRERLKELGKKGESYNDIITRLLREYEEEHERYIAAAGSKSATKSDEKGG